MRRAKFAYKNQGQEGIIDFDGFVMMASEVLAPGARRELRVVLDSRDRGL